LLYLWFLSKILRIEGIENLLDSSGAEVALDHVIDPTLPGFEAGKGF